MIEIRQLTKQFDRLTVLDGVDIHIPKGMIYGLVGRSGAGKSTLLRCINGLETYNEGSLLVDGIEVNSLSDKKLREFRREIGMIFQQFSLLNRLTVYENIALPMRCWSYSSSTIDQTVKRLVELVGIPDKIHARPRELSGGQKQRVAIARSLTMSPKLLLCDEATSALDPKTAQSITALLQEINQNLGITIIIVTHQMSVLRRTCEEISILENGKVAAYGPVEDIFLQHPQSLKNLLGQKDLPIPSEGITLKILLSHETSSQPLITRMARELNIDFIILGGELESYRNTTLGTLIINLPPHHLVKVEHYLAAHHIPWELVNSSPDTSINPAEEEEAV